MLIRLLRPIVSAPLVTLLASGYAISSKAAPALYMEAGHPPEQLFFAATPALANEGVAPSPASVQVLNQDVWDDNGIVRRRSLRTLAGLGPSSWDLKVLLAPLPELEEGYGSASAAMINILTGLDPESVAHPQRMTQLLLSRVNAADPEQTGVAVYGLGLLLGSRFGLSSYEASRAVLLQALKAPDPALRQRAAEAFGRFYPGQPGQLQQGSATPVMGLRGVAGTLADLTEDGDPKVRTASLDSIRGIARLGLEDGVQAAPLQPTTLVAIGRKRLSDSSPSVRIAAMDLLGAIPYDRLLSQTRGEIYNDVLTRVADSDPSVMAAALQALSSLDGDGYPDRRRRSEDLASLVTAGRIPSALVPSFLAAQFSGYDSSQLGDSEAGAALLKQLQQATSLGLRINASRLRQKLEQRGNSNAAGHISLIALYREGLASAQPLDQLDAIRGLNDLIISADNPLRRLALNKDLLDLLEPSLRSHVFPVRWAAAIASGQIDPNRSATLTVLGEMLGSLQEVDMRETVMNILSSSRSAEATLILTRKTQKESRALYYVRSCSVEGVGIPRGQEPQAARALTQPDCRRVFAESLPGWGERTSAETQATVRSLLVMLQPGEPDQRFAAAYALGKMLEPSSGGITNALRQKIITTLTSLYENPSENIEVRRIAATMLHLQGKNTTSFFDQNGLPMPGSACPNPQVRFTYGFKFDPYEGRCLYDTRTGCGAGMPEIYSKLRQLLGNRP